MPLALLTVTIYLNRQPKSATCMAITKLHHRQVGLFSISSFVNQKKQKHTAKTHIVLLMKKKKKGACMLSVGVVIFIHIHEPVHYPSYLDKS